jgi:hypothetical protein
MCPILDGYGVMGIFNSRTRPRVNRVLRNQFRCGKGGAGGYSPGQCILHDSATTYIICLFATSRYHMFVCFVTISHVCLLRHDILCLIATSRYLMFDCYVTISHVCLLRHDITCLFATSRYHMFICYVTI